MIPATLACLFVIPPAAPSASLHLPAYAIAQAAVSTTIDSAMRELSPRRITLPPGSYAVDHVLRELHKQTGNIVLDRRKQKPAAMLALFMNGLTFWEALEELCRQARCGFTPYAEGGLGLVDAPLRQQAVSRHGIFRTAVKRTNVVRDDETGVTACIVTVDVAWEPRFQPFYLGLGPVQVVFAPDAQGRSRKGQAPARGRLSVSGRSALEIEIRLDAPERSAPAIAKLEGSFTLLGPSKMLDVTLPELKVGAARNQEGVEVRINKVREGPERWLVELQIDNPEGTPAFESFQTWLDNNRAQLVRGAAGKQVVWRPEPGEAVLSETPRRAILEYAFADPAGKGKPADWALAVRTPGRIVEATAPFAFQTLALP